MNDNLNTASPDAPAPLRRPTSTWMRKLVGLAFWAALAAATATLIRRYDPDGDFRRRLLAHVTSDPPQFEASFPAATPLGVGNPVKVRTAGGLMAAGEVLGVEVRGETKHAVVAIYPEFAGRLGEETRLYSARTSGDVSWVVKTLLPPERMNQIKVILMRRIDREKAQLLADLEPGLLRLVDETFWLLKEDFPRVVAERKGEFKVLGEVLREKAWESNFETLFREDVWPLVEGRSQPLLKRIGNDIVDEFPVWAMSWAYMVQTLPFTDNNRVSDRVRGFIKEKAMPIVRDHGDEFRQMAAGVLRDTLKNEKTLKALQVSAEDVGRDPRFKDAVWAIVETWIVQNPRVRELLRGAWKRPDVRDPIEKFFARVEPDIKRVANLLLLNDERDGINPDLARVLRRKLLRENENWVLLELNEEAGGVPSEPLVGLDGGVR